MKKFFNVAINNPVSISVLSLFGTMLIWWIWLHFFIPNTSADILLLWTAIYPLVALYGAIFGFMASKRWGGINSFIGRAILAFSVGSLFQFIGQLVYNYYFYYLHIEVPYPSFAEVGFFGSVLFYIYGALMLASVSRTKITLQFIWSKVWMFFIPSIVLILSYVIFLRGYVFDWSNPVKIFFNFAYPLVDAIPISIALLAFSLSQKNLRGAIKLPIIFFILALVFQYLSDFVFVYQVDLGVISMGGINDLLYSISYILMAFSLILLSLWPSLLRD